MSDSSPAPQPLRAGIIGCGWFGGVHAERLRAIPGVYITALSDPNEAAMQKVAELIPPTSHDPKRLEIARYADWKDLIKHEGLDFIVINSPNRWHVEQLLAGLAQGLHVLCEKPLTMEPSEVAQVVEATQAAEKVVAISYQSRYRRDSRVLRRALQSGQWGRITSIDVFASENWVTPNIGTWRHDPARCPGGYFGDANGHQLDVLFWMTGLEAEWVRATTELRGTPVPMFTWGEARLFPQGGGAIGENGQGVPFTFTFAGDARIWREEIAIITEKADFVIRNTELLWSDGSAPLAPFPESAMHPDDVGQPDLPDAAFVEALRGGKPVLSPPETVWATLRFTLTALASAQSGEKQPAKP